MKKDKPKLKKISVNLPFSLGSAEWQYDPIERKAAWELYVELITRISTQTLTENQGTLREAIGSLQSLFPTTREILRKYGPDLGISENTVGGIAIVVVNQGLRPFLTKWHHRLTEWETLKEPNGSQKSHEDKWSENKNIRNDLESLRKELLVYAKALANISGTKEHN